MDGRRRHAARAARRPAVGHGDARDERGTRPQAARRRPASPPIRSSRSGRPTCRTSTRRARSSAQPAAAVDPGGLKREVFGFLPYWELTDRSTRLDWEKLSTVAYFGVGAAANGDLQKRNSDGSTTVGWSGWTSSKMTAVINAAHASGARVVLTVQSFAWSSSGVARQKALLGSPANRANLARQIAAAVRDRGADGVNLDFEPIVATYADEFTALVRTVRSELNKVHAGYQLTFDTTGWIGNYPIEKAHRGRRRRTPSWSWATTTAARPRARSGRSRRSAARPTTSPTRSAAYLGRIPAVEGHPRRALLRPGLVDRHRRRSTPRTSRAPSTAPRRPSSTARPARYAADHGRKWDPVEGSAWTVYRRKNCTAKYGCVNALAPDLLRRRDRARPQVRPRQPREPARRRHLGARLRRDPDRAVRGAQGQVHHRQGPAADHRGRAQRARSSRPTATAGSTPCRLDVAVTGHIRFGWVVQPVVRRGRRPRDPLRREASASASSYTWDGRDERGRAGRPTASTGSRSGPRTPRTTGRRSRRSSPSIAARPR